MARLDVKGLSYTYPGAAAATLLDINFSVPAGKSLALLGSSGAGKTTLLNLLSGLLSCTSGSICFDGVDVSKRVASKRGVAQVFQFPVMYDSLTAIENIAFPLRTLGVGRIDRKRRAAEVAQLFDLGDVLEKKPQDLSLFQKQLVGFAKALVRDDLAMVLLDEPLTAVEPAMKWRLRATVKRAQAEMNTTMVYVTHDQTEALTFADEVSVLHGGRLLQTGTSQELFDKPAHAEVARFIGNPGMNLLSAEVIAGRLLLAGERAIGALSEPIEQLEGALQVGFRPEWGRLADRRAGHDQQPHAEAGSLCVPVTLVSTRLTGAEAGKQVGVARVAVGDTTTRVVCSPGPQLDNPLQLLLDRYELFCDGKRVTGGESAPVTEGVGS